MRIVKYKEYKLKFNERDYKLAFSLIKKDFPQDPETNNCAFCGRHESCRGCPFEHMRRHCTMIKHSFTKKQLLYALRRAKKVKK